MKKLIFLKRNLGLYFFIEKSCMFPLLSPRRKIKKKEEGTNWWKEWWRKNAWDRLCRFGTAIVASLHRLMVLRIPLSGLVVALRRSDAAERMEKAPKGTVVCRSGTTMSACIDQSWRFSRGYRYICIYNIYDILKLNINFNDAYKSW